MTATKTESNRDKAFALFDKGHGASSKEVRDLGLKSTTRNTYMSDWRALRSGTVRTTRIVGKTTLPGGESVAGIKEKPEAVKSAETKAEPIVTEAEEEEEGTEAKSIESRSKETVGIIKAAGGNGEGKTLKEKLSSVAGEGLIVQVSISTKSMLLYQVARTMQQGRGDELTLGDFIDDAIEDMFAGRGLELGLIQTNQKEGAKS